VVPVRDASFQVLRAVRRRLEGLDFTFAILDEFGRIDHEAYEVAGLASGKRESPVLNDMREYAKEHPGDASLVWREFSAAGLRITRWTASTAGSWPPQRWATCFSAGGIAAFLPPKTRESPFRQSRLCQFSDEVDDAWLPPRAWAACGDLRTIEQCRRGPRPGRFVQSARDRVGGVSARRPAAPGRGRPVRATTRQPDWRAPVLEVEQRIRDCCLRWSVRTILADPFRRNRSVQLPAEEAYPYKSFRKARSA
jgi:hypothetical protein